MALLSFSGAAAVSLSTGIPRPGVADEFCYLLNGDTFARFRLTNSPHPLWKHFESYYIFHEPTYSSKYPPAQGILLAAGYLLGHPVIGVWLGAAALSAAITWMLWAWLPPPWALLGGLLATLKFGISGYWAQSYLAAAIVAVGGALLYGGLRRVLDEPRAANALWIGVGLVVLANSRPYEGLIFSLPAGLILLAWFVRSSELSLRGKLKVVALPIVLILGLGTVWTLSHNRAVTGNPLKLPYMVSQETYPFISLFVWQKDTYGTSYRHQEFRQFERQNRWWTRQGNPLERRFRLLKETYLPGLLWLPIVLLPLAWRDRWTLGAVSICVFLLAGQLLTVPLLPHYSAPATGLLFFLVVQAVRSSARIPRIGRVLACGAALGTVLLFAVNTVAQARADNSGRWGPIQRVRPEIESRLRDLGGGHVVIVRYGKHHRPGREWVYNTADIDGQRVIWARDRGDLLNWELIRYYEDRQIWLLRVDFESDPQGDPAIAPYRPKRIAALELEDLAEVLEMVRQRRDRVLSKRLLKALMDSSGDAVEALEPGAIHLAGLRHDLWTRGNRPAAIALRNEQSEAAVPVLTIYCHGGDSLPVTLTIDDGKKQREIVFHRPGRRKVRLRRVPPGEDRLLMLWTDKGWRGSNSRWLGARVEAVALRTLD